MYIITQVRVAAPMMECQRSASDFEFIGIDFMASADGKTAWLLENNCPPGTTSATGERERE